MRRLIAAGIGFSIISARPPTGMLWIADRLGLTGPIAAFNGGTLLSPDGEVLATYRLGRDAAARALRAIDGSGAIAWLFAAGVWHAARLDANHDVRERKSANQEPVVGGDWSGLLDHADKIVAVSDDHAMLAALEGEVAGLLGADATVARSQPYYLDITAPAANKGDGVAALAEAYGMTLAEVAVFGDQRNDLAMFARAGTSVAMGQAPEEVRARAGSVSASNDDDGVAVAIDRLLDGGRQ